MNFIKSNTTYIQRIQKQKQKANTKTFAISLLI